MCKFIRTVIAIITCLYSTLTFAQCNGERYLNPIFTSTRTHENVSYNFSYALTGGCAVESLQALSEYTLDIYEPDGDTVSKRPCIVYAHGGAFLIGDKRIVPVEEYCYEMSKRGFVVFSIDYRKCFNTASTPSIERAVYRAVQDMNAAVRWVKAHAEIYRVDSSMVFAGGNSAGSIMAIFNAYGEEDERAAIPSTYDQPDMGCMNCSGNSFIASPKPRAVLNYWGATLDTNIIEAGDQPMLSMHGNADNGVPFDYGVPFSYPAFPPVYGSLNIDTRLGHLGIVHELYVFEGMGHEPWLTDAAQLDTIVEVSSRFLFEHFLKPPPPVIEGPTDICIGDTVTYSIVGANASSYYCWNLSGAQMVNSNYNQSSMEVVWLGTNSYPLKVRESNQWQGTGALSSIVVNVLGNPVNEMSSDTAICMGDSIELNSGLASTYSWQPSEGLSDTAIANPIAYPDTTTTYYVIMMNNICVEIDSVKITVNLLPYIYAGPDGQLCQGQSSHTLDGWPIGTAFHWTPQDDLSPPGSWHPVATPDTTTIYTYHTTDTNGCSNTDQMTLYVYPLPPIPGVMVSGDSLLAPLGYSYQWLINSQEIIGATNQYLLPIETGAYSVKVTDSNGCYNTSQEYQYVGIESKDEVLFNIYPNPAQTFVYISFLDEAIGDEMRLIDLSGRLIQSERIIGNKHGQYILDVSNLPNGVYQLEFSGDFGVSNHKLLIAR